MSVNREIYSTIQKELSSKKVQLVAVSKLQPVSAIQKMYDLGQRDFGENYVQELVEKQALLPADVRWHFIGHLQSNKVKLIVPFVYLIHSVDSLKLLNEINKQGNKINRIIYCLLQIHIAQEETKFGLDENELSTVMNALQSSRQQYANVCIDGLMGMASFSDDAQKVRTEMKSLKSLFDEYSFYSIGNIETTHESASPLPDNSQLSTLSMGMSGDYEMAIEEGSNMVRIGSLLFGARPAK